MDELIEKQNKEFDDKFLDTFIEYENEFGVCGKLGNKDFYEEVESHISKIREEIKQQTIKQKDEVFKAYQKLLISRVKREERKAWLGGERCFTCGKEKEPSATSDTCSKCWDEE